jgi:Phytochelatin synthase
LGATGGKTAGLKLVPVRPNGIPMPILTRLALALLLAAAHLPAFALDNPPAAATQALVPFASDEGLARLARSNARVDFPLLANQYEEELDATFCGPASAAMVLNAVNARSGNLPKDMSRLHPDDLKYLPPGVDPIIPRYTQDNVMLKSPKTRAQVLGEPTTVNKPLAPVLLVRGDIASGLPLIVADGYHRICAVCYFDESARIRCRIAGIADKRA